MFRHLPRSQLVLLLRRQHGWLLLEHKQFVPVKSVGDEVKVGIREVVEVDAVYFRTEIDLAAGFVNDWYRFSIAGLTVSQRNWGEFRLQWNDQVGTIDCRCSGCRYKNHDWL